MNHTPNYNLPQWEANDPVRREDFNAAMETIDGAMAAAKTAGDTAQTAALMAQNTANAAQSAVGTAQSTAEAAQTTATQAQSAANAAQSAANVAQTAANNAQGTANAAQTAAAAAQQTADKAWAPDNPPFVLGSYKGTGSNTTNKITIGFTPQVFLISDGGAAYFAAYGQGTLCDADITWNSDGISLTSDDDYDRMDRLNKWYYYCAFR